MKLDLSKQRIVRRKVADLVPYSRNSRTHSNEQVEAIVASIRRWGWTNPILIDETDLIIAGHGRRLAALAMGVVEVPCIVAKGWTEEERRAYVIADNQLALQADWDRDLLRVEVLDLTEAGFETELLGFDALELKGILQDTSDLGDVEEEFVPAPEVPVSAEGQLWHLGKHRLLCGDSTKAEDVERLLDGARPFLMVTDPPYGVEYDPAWRNEVGTSRPKRTGKVANDDRVDWTEAWQLAPCNVAYVWHPGVHAEEVARSLQSADFQIRSQIVWAKPRFALSRGNYHWQHEPCFYALRGTTKLSAKQKRELVAEVERVLDGELGEDHTPCWYAFRGKGGARWIGDRKQSTVWEIRVSDDGDKTKHGTQKPLECMARPMRNHDADEIYEPFGGSGSTLVAAEILGRTCFAMELDPTYVDVIIQRWQNRTGQDACLATTGETFQSLAAKAR